MQNKRILVKLNFMHLSLVLLVLILLFFINLLAVRNLQLREVAKGLATKGYNLYNQLNASKKGIETSANNFMGLARLNMEFDLLLNYYNQSLPQNPLIESFYILEYEQDQYSTVFKYTKSDADKVSLSVIQSNVIDFYQSGLGQNWINSFNKDSYQYRFYFFGRISQNKLIVITYSIFRARMDNPMAEGGFPAIFNVDNEVIFHPLIETPYNYLIADLPQRVLSQLPEKYSDKNKSELKSGVFLRDLRPYSDNERYMSFLIFDEDLQWYITMNQPYSLLYNDLYMYFKKTGLWFLFIILFVSGLVLLINHTQLKPAIDIAIQMKESPFLDKRYLSDGNELTTIRKGVDLLQNQLNQYITSFEKNAIDRSKLERDLQVAKKLQRNVLPAGNLHLNNHPNFEIYALSESAFDIGGDLYDYFMIDDDHLLFVVGDVAGKGIPASLFMIFTHTLLRSVAKPNTPIKDIVMSLNDKLIEENISDLFVTLFVGQLNIHSGEFNYCNAAHCAPFLIHTKGELIELSQTHGIPIGIYAKKEYSQSCIVLQPNDMIFVYTDGVIDAKDENGMNFSEDVLKFNLMGTWFKSCEETVSKIKESVDNFRGNMNPEDDITLLALKYKGTSSSS